MFNLIKGIWSDLVFAHLDLLHQQINKHQLKSKTEIC